MNITFNIYGNHEDPEGNPIPYVRSTQGALWRPNARRYSAWKGYVQKSLIIADFKDDAVVQIRNNMLRLGKPFEIGNRKARMDLIIHWKNNAHGDPDNIFKGIADALFWNDKNLDGSFESRLSQNNKGRVEVTLLIP